MPGEEVGFDEVPFAYEKGRNLILTAPTAGGGAAGAVLVDSPREEVRTGRIPKGLGGVDPDEIP